MSGFSRSLFLRIFLWFGITMLTMMAITFLVGEFARHDHMSHSPQMSLAGYDDAAVQAYELEGREALAVYLGQTDRATKMHTFLYGQDLVELSGRSASGAAREVAQTVIRTRRPAFTINGPSPLLAYPVQAASGSEYVFVAQLTSTPEPPLTHHLSHLLGLFLVGAAFCFWLAKYLTSPIATLRRATRELAQGNLAARVSPSLGKRRDELASLGTDFDVMAGQIESLLLAQRRLLGDISHELRSPLARLNVALELARERAGLEATSALERIQREAENLNEMIGQLLALTRLETGAGRIPTTHFDLARLVRGIAEDAEFEARSRNRSVRVSSCESFTILGNEELLRPAIENVVRNAVQYTAEGTAIEICLKAGVGNSDTHKLSAVQRNDRELVNKRDETGFAEITVRDQGSGVPENAIDKIFLPFYRVDDARDRESGGTGLGLAITERAVRLHGGTIGASNAKTGGLVVRIVLPITAVTPATQD